eukprot:4985581-Pleurochrysis_carterae.AAC.1
MAPRPKEARVARWELHECVVRCAVMAAPVCRRDRKNCNGLSLERHVVRRLGGQPSQQILDPGSHVK